VRIRALKPGFFTNELLAELSPWHRLCFQGLWLCADREGRLQDRPKRLKAEIFPYDDLDMNMLLWDLTRTGFVIRYQIGAHPYLWIPTWDQHQHPREDERASDLPAYVPGSERAGGPEVTTFPAVRPIGTDPSLHGDDPETPKRIGNGDLEVGNGTSGEAASPLHVRAQDLLELWNATMRPPFPKCRELTDGRRQKIRARLRRRPSLTEWREAFEAIQVNAFYRGENDRAWVADFDWVIKNDTVIAKVLERKRTPRAVAAVLDRSCPHDAPCANPGSWECQTRTERERIKAEMKAS
jgi:hypothetical protein